MAAENKIKELVKNMTPDEKADAITVFTDAELITELTNRLNARANSLAAVFEALGGGV